MSKLDKDKICKRSIERYEWFSDIKPKKSIRKYKRKERQAGKSEIRKELKNGESQKKEK